VAGFALERCRKCGFVYTNPRYPPDAVLGQYEQEDSGAEMLALWGRIHTPTMLAEYDRILDDLAKELPGRGRLLDVGCGACYFLERAQRQGWEAHGVEVASWAPDAARARGVTHLHVGLLHEQRFPDGAFDVVHTAQVLEHLADPRDVLREMHRVLRPGGLFYANVPNYRRLPVLFNVDDFVLDQPMGHLNYFTPTSLRHLVEAVGFRVVRTSTFGGLKWENLLGLPTGGEVVEANRHPPADANGTVAADTALTPRRPAFLKRLVQPLVKQLAYKWAQVGLTLELFARKT
jgi:SAM-dependent methyltransferase